MCVYSADHLEYTVTPSFIQEAVNRLPELPDVARTTVHRAISPVLRGKAISDRTPTRLE